MTRSRMLRVLLILCVVGAFSEAAYRIFPVWQHWGEFPGNAWRSPTMTLLELLPRMVLSVGAGFALLLLTLVVHLLDGTRGWRRRVVIAAGASALLLGLAPCVWFARAFALSLRLSRWGGADLPLDIAAIDTARQALVSAALWSLPAWGGTLFLVCLVGPHSTRGPKNPTQSVLLGLSAALIIFVATMPLTVENEHLLDERFHYSSFQLGKTIEGVGPDLLEEAPLVELVETRVVLDGLDSDLLTNLQSKRELWMMLRPAERFPGRLNWSIDPAVKSRKLVMELREALRAGYSQHALMLREEQRHVGPIFVDLQGRRFTSLVGHVVQSRRDCSHGATAVWWRDLEGLSMSALVESLLASRGGGPVQCWVLGPPIPEFQTETRSSTQALAGGLDLMRIEQGANTFDVVLVPALCSGLHPCRDQRGDFVRIETQLLSRGSDFSQLEERLALEERDLIFAMNAGMFHEDRRPVGLLVHGGATIANLNLEEGEGNFFIKPNGVWGIRFAGFFIGESQDEDWWNDALIEATQSGPILLQEGKRNPRISPASRHRKVRNGVGVDSHGNSLFVISKTPVTFFELLTLFENLGCSEALYLDGVVSALYLPQTGRRDLGRGLGPIVLATLRRYSSSTVAQ